MSQLHSPSVGGQGVSPGQPIDLTADDSPTSEGTPLLPVIEDRAPVLGVSAGWQNSVAAGRQERPRQAAVAAQVQLDACSAWLCWRASVCAGQQTGWPARAGDGRLGARMHAQSKPCWPGLSVSRTVIQVASWRQQWQLGSPHTLSDSATACIQVRIKQEGLSTQAGVAAVKPESEVPGQARGQAPQGPLPVEQPARYQCQKPCLQPHSCCCPTLPCRCA